MTRAAFKGTAVLLALAALVVAAPAAASEQHPSQAELEAMLVCPSCHVPLDESNSPIAQQMKAFIATRIAAGDTRSEIVDELVGPPNNLGVAVLGVPRTHGFDLVAWVLPFLGIAIGALAIGAGAWKWSRARSEPAAAPLDPESERSVDEALARFDSFSFPSRRDGGAGPEGTVPTARRGVGVAGLRPARVDAGEEHENG